MLIVDNSPNDNYGYKNNNGSDKDHNSYKSHLMKSSNLCCTWIRDVFW